MHFIAAKKAYFKTSDLNLKTWALDLTGLEIPFHTWFLPHAISLSSFLAVPQTGMLC